MVIFTENNVFVSIVIPVYNNIEYIEQCLDSCFYQTYKNFEVIVIDDNSSDKIYEVTKKYNVTYIRNKKNMGPSYSRNIGIKVSKGEAVSFIDSDDIMMPNKLKLSVPHLKGKIGMTCGNYKVLLNRLRLLPNFYSTKLKIDIDLLMRQNFVACGSTTVRRDVFDDVGLFNENYWIAEDYDMWVRISEKYSIEYIHDVLYYYSVIKRGKSLTQDGSRSIEQHINILKIKEESRERRGV